MTMTNNVTILQGSRSSELAVGVLCINMEPTSRERLDSLVAQIPGAHLVDNVDRQVTAREVLGLLEQFQHRVCVVDFDESEDSGRTCRRLLEGGDGSVSVFAASSDSSPEQIIRAMRCGCSEYLIKPFQPDQVVDALAQVQARRRGSSQAQKGRVITLMGAKGGTGVTSLAIHLALTLLQKNQQKCLLVDEHPALGDVSLYLGLTRNRYSFYELVYNVDRLDADLLQGFLLHHGSGLSVLDSPEVIHAFPGASPEAIEHTLAFLAENYQFVILDCPPGLSEDTCAAIRQSDRVAILITPELPAIHNAIRAMKYLTGLHYPEDNIDIVLNRHSKRSALSDNEIEASLHRPVAVRIPNSYDQIVNAINAGTPIDLGHKSELPAAFGCWAARLMGEEPAAATVSKGSRGLFSLLRS
jgi:pilus assembly protein CpaE